MEKTRSFVVVWNRLVVLSFADIADVSLEEARRRFSEMQRHSRFNAIFYCANPYRDSIDHLIKDVGPFDLVSSQFSFHYCFSSEENVRAALGNVSRNLRKGGKFIATIPDPFEIRLFLFVDPRRRIENYGAEFGNEYYTIKFETTEIKTFGTKYWFTLCDAVDDCPEYLIDIPSLLSFAIF